MTLAIHDLPHSRELDRQARCRVRGGFRSLQEMGPFANVQVNVNQNINQNQVVSVNALNNVGVIGADFGFPRLNVSPVQAASTGLAL